MSVRRGEMSSRSQKSFFAAQPADGPAHRNALHVAASRRSNAPQCASCRTATPARRTMTRSASRRDECWSDCDEECITLRRVLAGLRRGVHHAARTDRLTNVPVIPDDVIVIYRRPSERPHRPAKIPLQQQRRRELVHEHGARRRAPIAAIANPRLTPVARVGQSFAQ